MGIRLLIKLKHADEITALADGAGPPEKTIPTFLFPLYPVIALPFS